jgi:hypothetical protein
MTTIITSKKYGQQAALFGLAAMGIYLLMIYLTLARIQALSGHRPFDMRPGGYSVEQANLLLDALGVSGRQYYLTRQIPLDLVYPALMALTQISLLKWLGSRGASHTLVRIGSWLSIGAAVTDYIENAGICLLILSWPDTSDIIVLLASTATIVKSGLTMAAVLTLILGVVFWVITSCRTNARADAS